MMKATNLAELYEMAPLDWTRIRHGLDAGFDQEPGGGGPDRHTCWLTTINTDASPHVTAVGAIWVDDAFWFQTGAGTGKGRNIDRDPRCVLSLAAHDFDLVVEGEARRVVDPDTVASMAAKWADQGWPARVDDSGQALTAEYSAPSAGPPPWFVYRLEPRTATAVLTVEPGGATRWHW
jgi:hypothetical protein